MWTFNITTGELLHDAQPIAHGYSGHGPSINNPQNEHIQNQGPVPEGFYTIAPPIDHTHLGPIAMALEPAPGNSMFGRSGFWIHGDSLQHPDQASHGCICLPNHARSQIALSTDHQLSVTT